MLTNAVFEFVVSVGAKLRERFSPGVLPVAGSTMKIINAVLMSAFLVTAVLAVGTGRLNRGT